MKALKAICILFGLVLLPQLSNALVYESISSGNWFQTNTWSGGVIPPSQTDDITIIVHSNHNVTFNPGWPHSDQPVEFLGENVHLTIDGSLLVSFHRGMILGAGTRLEVNGWLRNNSIFRVTGESEVVVNGSLLNNGWIFQVGDDTDITISEGGLIQLNGTSSFGNNVNLHVMGQFLNNAGGGVTFGDGAEIFVHPTGVFTTQSSMSFGDPLLLFIEGAMYVNGWNFSLGDEAQIFLFGLLEIGNDWVFHSGSSQNYLYICNGSADLPQNIGMDAVVVEVNCGVLPVELLGFEAISRNNSVVLQWATASETNSDFFTIERSEDACHWEAIGLENAAGNSNAILNYTFTDTYVSSGIWYYRLRQTDLDGSYEYFKPIMVDVNHQTHDAFTIHWTRQQTNVTVSASFEKGATLTIVDIHGRLLLHHTFCQHENHLTFYADTGQTIFAVKYDNPRRHATPFRAKYSVF